MASQSRAANASVIVRLSAIATADGGCASAGDNSSKRAKASSHRSASKYSWLVMRSSVPTVATAWKSQAASPPPVAVPRWCVVASTTLPRVRIRVMYATTSGTCSTSDCSAAVNTPPPRPGGNPSRRWSTITRSSSKHASKTDQSLRLRAAYAPSAVTSAGARSTAISTYRASSAPSAPTRSASSKIVTTTMRRSVSSSISTRVESSKPSFDRTMFNRPSRSPRTAIGWIANSANTAAVAAMASLKAGATFDRGHRHAGAAVHHRDAVGRQAVGVVGIAVPAQPVPADRRADRVVVDRRRRPSAASSSKRARAASASSGSKVSGADHSSRTASASARRSSGKNSRRAPVPNRPTHSASHS